MLSIKNLNICVANHPIIKNLNLEITEGKIIALVGESGSGKTTLTKAITKQLGQAFEKKGSIELNHQSIDKIKNKQFYGKQVGIIYQKAEQTMHPSISIGKQLDLYLASHTNLNKNKRYQMIINTLNQVKIENPEHVYHLYPFQLSGGMNQRVMIASILLVKPQLLIADEPTSALDISTQKELLHLFLQTIKKEHMTCLFVTHDLLTANFIADEIGVLKDGQLIELNDKFNIINNAKQPYTKSLINQVKGSIFDHVKSKTN